jgi:hypothetical protein
MKLSRLHPGQQRQRGSAVVVMLMLLGMLLFWIGVNLRALSNLERELKFTERRQIRRLSTLTVSLPPANPGQVANTNAAPIAP